MPRRRYKFLMPAEDHFFIKRYTVNSRVWFTDEGKIMAGVMFVGIMMASPGLQIAAYLLPIFIFTLFLISIIFSQFTRPAVEVHRQLPSPPSAGDYYVYQVVVINRGSKALRNLKISEDMLPYGLYDAPDHPEYQDVIEWLEPGAQAILNMVIRCKFRGVYGLKPLLIGTCFPSGLTRWPVRGGANDRMVVYPSFIPQIGFQVPFLRVYQPGGIAISSHVGDSTEFLSTREYRSGDRLRDIHWASYARAGRLIVKEYVDEYFIRVGLFLDTQLSRQEKESMFEQRISTAAGIADAIAKKDYIIDLFAAGDVLHHFQMGRALAHLENLLELLACVESMPKIDFELLTNGLQPYINKLSSLIILLGDWDEPREKLCRRLEVMGVELRVIVVREAPLSRPASRLLTVVNPMDTEAHIQ